jgi:hypothetical protein
MPRLSNLTALLRACHMPELLVNDEECLLLLKRYVRLCTEPERIFFERLAAMLPDPRLALCVVPQRQVDSLVGGTDAVRAPGGRVDFAIELPLPSGSNMLRLVIEVDDVIRALFKMAHTAREWLLLKKVTRIIQWGGAERA